MEIRTIRYFLAVAEAGSITEAARALHISQPPLSAAMAKLEGELGVSLFERLPRGVRLTPAGRYLQASGRRLLAEERRTASTLRAMGQGMEGQLRLGAEAIGLRRAVSRQIARFLGQHPKVVLELTDAAPRVLVESLASGQLDLAVIPVLPEEPIPPIDDAHFDVTIIGSVRLTLLVPREWEFSVDGELELSQLNEVQWVLPGPLRGARSLSRILDDRFVEVGGRPVRVIEVPTVQTAASLVAAGVGVTVTSMEMADTHPNVEAVRVRGGWRDLPLGLVQRREGVLPPVARKFLDLFLSDATKG